MPDLQSNLGWYRRERGHVRISRPERNDLGDEEVGQRSRIEKLKFSAEMRDIRGKR